VIKFSVEGKPESQGSMKVFNGHIVHNKSKELMAWRKLIADEAKLAGCQENDFPISISMRFFLIRPNFNQMSNL